MYGYFTGIETLFYLYMWGHQHCIDFDVLREKSRTQFKVVKVQFNQFSICASGNGKGKDCKPG